MRKDQNPHDPSLLCQSKGNIYLSQEQRLAKVFSCQSVTMLQASRATDIERANITRWIAKLRKEGTVYLTEKKIDPLTGCRAGYYTTNQTFKL